MIDTRARAPSIRRELIFAVVGQGGDGAVLASAVAERPQAQESVALLADRGRNARASEASAR
ncbi:hypothetical protein C449_05707 [Halococcus saccharolyticus DSM 5350]|uniref:Uncharacterized protein n=1 Tax=Halococcus saccharolyticus DSM 5350 TaxID=1227455 RepID=M0MKJ3_9EURY|nr:hypothetical protein C449_05707 [Halococcus saccharolyticus DSM 5350]